MIYLDHAATSFPKPPSFWEELRVYQEEIGGSPGRGAHKAAERAAEMVYETRLALARLFGADDPKQIVFTANATESLNLALQGLLRPGDHVVSTELEHNSMLRPLHRLSKTRGVRVSYVPVSPSGELDPGDIAKALEPRTKLVAVNHGSNVTGSVLPLEEIAQLVGQIPLLVDATQTAGLIPIDVKRLNIALLAFTGHKSLYGPTGIGGLYLREDQRLEPLKTGGTGSLSELPEQPDFLPDRYESGTLNLLGIAGLKGSLRFLSETGLEAIQDKEQRLFRKLFRGLSSREGVRLYGPPDTERRTGTICMNLAGREPQEVSYLLDRVHDIQTRSGLHCSPWVHRALGTFPGGAVRVSVGFFNTEEEIDALLGAVDEILLQNGL